MSIVVEVIAEHLRTNRRLVVPGFGAFMVKESGERVFSDLLRSDDGVLTSLLRNRGLSEMEAAVMTDRFLFEMRHDLEKYGYYRLGTIGTLRIEPDTKCLRLNPPVHGELPKAKPYIPQPILDERRKTRDERRKTKDESIRVEERTEEKEVQKVITKVSSVAPKAPSTPKKSIKPRKRVDFVVVAAIVIVLAAIIAIGYGYYVSTLAEGESSDDAAMDALRVVPEQTRN